MKRSKRINLSPKLEPSKKSPRAPVGVETPLDLASWQRLMHEAITRPLTDGDRTQGHWSDGRVTADVISPLVKGNERLQPIERLEIYNRMYWFRLLDCIADDCPGLRSLLGDDHFWKLAGAYLSRYPSRSYTLRNLCANLPNFLKQEPIWTTPFTAQAIDVARFEWAQIVAFDGPALKPITRREIQKTKPDELRLCLQPHLSLLALSYAADEYILAVKRGDAALRAEASQAVVERRAAQSSTGEGAFLKKEKINVAVHRSDNTLYYKRIDPGAAAILRGLAAGRPLADACARAMRSSPLPPKEQASQVQAWFALWMRLGWLCPRD